MSNLEIRLGTYTEKSVKIYKNKINNPFIFVTTNLTRVVSQDFTALLNEINKSAGTRKESIDKY